MTRFKRVSGTALALVVIALPVFGQETPQQRETRQESRRIEAENRAQREQRLQRWIARADRLVRTDIGADAEIRRVRAFHTERMRAREDLLILALALEQLDVLDPASSPEILGQTASRAAVAVDRVGDFLRRSVDQVPDVPPVPGPADYAEGVAHLVGLFRELMSPMAVVMDGETLDLAMHDEASVILVRMGRILEALPAFARR